MTTKIEAAPVDVLAVMDAACKLHAEGAYADAWEVELTRIAEVRAAVAELIEALRVTSTELERQINDPQAKPSEGFHAANVARAAIARVGGAK